MLFSSNSFLKFLQFGFGYILVTAVQRNVFPQFYTIFPIHRHKWILFFELLYSSLLQLFSNYEAWWSASGDMIAYTLLKTWWFIRAYIPLHINFKYISTLACIDVDSSEGGWAHTDLPPNQWNAEFGVHILFKSTQGTPGKVSPKQHFRDST